MKAGSWSQGLASITVRMTWLEPARDVLRGPTQAQIASVSVAREHHPSGKPKRGWLEAGDAIVGSSVPNASHDVRHCHFGSTHTPDISN